MPPLADDMGAIFKAILAELITARDVRLTIARLDRDQRDLLRRALASVQDIDVPAIKAPGGGSTAWSPDDAARLGSPPVRRGGARPPMPRA